MVITKKSFKKIRSIILIFLIVDLLFLGTSMLNGKPYEATYWSWIDLYSFLALGIFISGLIWFIVSTVKYVKGKSYLTNAISIRTIGGLTGLSWFVLLEVLVLIILTLNYYHNDKMCPSFWGNNPDTLCSLLDYLTHDFNASLILNGSFIFSIPFPIIMYVIGYCVDKYTTKKIKFS